jgi:5'-nucleotidase
MAATVVGVRVPLSLLLLAGAVLALGAPAAHGAATVGLQVVGVNDLHGNLEVPEQRGGRALGGVAQLATEVERVRAHDPRGTIVVHAGDLVGGSPPISSWLRDEPTIEAANAIGFDVGTPGNHELDRGVGEMLRLIGGGAGADPHFPGAAFPYVSANLVRRDGDLPLLAPYTVLQRRGVRIGVVGVLTPQTATLVDPATMAGLRILDMAGAVNRAVSALRRRSIHTIVVLAHAGGDELLAAAARMSGDVDLVVGGHTHERMLTRVGRRVVVQAGRYGEAVDVVSLRVRRRDGQVVAARARLADVDDRLAPDGQVAALVARARSTVAARADRVVAVAAQPTAGTATATGETPIGDVVADAQRRAAGSDLALVHPGSIRADLPAGPLTVGRLFSVLPWSTGVVATTLTGAQVRAALAEQFATARPRILQVSGLGWRRDGRSVVDVTVDGQPLDDARDYRVALNDPLAEGADGFTVLAGGRDVAPVADDVDVLAGQLAGDQPFAPPDPAQAPRITGGA